jgi:hypothetical protein
MVKKEVMLVSKNAIVKDRVIKKYRKWRDKQLFFPDKAFREDVRFIIDLAIEEEIRFLKGKVVLANYVALIEGDREENRKEYINQEKSIEVIILKKFPLPPTLKRVGIRGANL